MYSPGTNFRKFAESRQKTLLFLAVFAGIVAHWLYEVAVEVIRTSAFAAPSVPVLLARQFVSFVAAAAGFAAIFNQASKAEPGFEVLTAFTAGLAVDALTSPWTQPTS